MANPLNRVPLQSLRAVEAVARLGSLRTAAEDMGVTAAQLALDTDPAAEPRSVKVHAEVVLRDSTRLPGGAPGDR